MSKLKRLKKKRDLRKKANIREMVMKRQMKSTLGTDKMADEMIRDHQGVLQNIEFAIVSCRRNNNKIDDSVIAGTLKAAIHSEEPTGELSAELKRDLDDIRQTRSDIADDLWRNGLRTILQSVHLHSNLRPGSRGYIDFVSQFII